MIITRFFSNITNDILAFRFGKVDDLNRQALGLVEMMKMRKLNSYEMKSLLLGVSRQFVQLKEYPDLVEAIKSQFNANKNFYNYQVYSTLIWFIKRKRLYNPALILDALTTLPTHVPKMGAKNLTMTLEGLAYLHREVNEDLLELLHTRIQQLAGKFDAQNLPLVLSYLRVIHAYNMKGLEIYDTLEEETYRLQESLSVAGIATILSTFAKVTRKRSSDIFNRLQPVILRRFDEINDNATVPIILNAYCQTAIYRYYENIFTQCAKEIYQNTDKYLSSPQSILSIIHAFAKTGFGNKVIEKITSSISLTPDLFNDSEFNLGVYIYNLIRCNISTQTKKTVCSWLILYQNAIQPHHMKKIIALLIKSEDLKEFLSKLEHKELITFTDADYHFIEGYVIDLQKLGFSVNLERN
jgi:hypothetical protein